VEKRGELYLWLCLLWLRLFDNKNLIIFFHFVILHRWRGPWGLIYLHFDIFTLVILDFIGTRFTRADGACIPCVKLLNISVALRLLFVDNDAPLDNLCYSVDSLVAIAQECLIILPQVLSFPVFQHLSILGDLLASLLHLRDALLVLALVLHDLSEHTLFYESLDHHQLMIVSWRRVGLACKPVEPWSEFVVSRRQQLALDLPPQGVKLPLQA
jgi:hypothetical protein